MKISTPILAELRSALRACMSSERGMETKYEWPAEFDSELREAAARHRVIQPLVAHAQVLGIPPESQADLRQVLDNNAVATLRVLSSLRSIQQILTNAEIPHLVFKGMALAVQTTGDPFGRGFGDIDLLVAGSDLRKTLVVLQENGWLQNSGIPVQGSWAARYHLATAYEITLSQGGVDLDLHWRLDLAAHALPAFDELWARRTRVAAGPVELETLDPATALRHTITHAAKDNCRLLRSLVDLHRLSRHPDLNSDWMSHLRPIDRRVVAIAEDALGDTEFHAIARASQRQLQKALELQASPEHPPASTRLTPEWIRATLESVQSSRHPADWTLAFLNVSFQSRDFADVADQHAVTAIPKALMGRARHLAARFSVRRHNRENLRRTHMTRGIPEGASRGEGDTAFDHFVITRFSAVFGPGAPPMPPEWLDYRLNFFEQACCASLGRQSTTNFRWLVYFDDRCTAEFSARVESLAEAYGFEPIWTHDNFWSRVAADVHTRASKPFVITTRVDSDDAVSRDLVESIQQQFSSQDRLFVHFMRGLQVDREGAVYRFDYPAGPFMSLIERRTEALPLTVYCTGHGQVRQLGPLREVITTPKWLMVVHGANLMNEIQGSRVHPKVLALHFDIDLPYNCHLSRSELLRAKLRHDASLWCWRLKRLDVGWIRSRAQRLGGTTTREQTDLAPGRLGMAARRLREHLRGR